MLIRTILFNGFISISLLAGMAMAEPAVVELTQVPCQFLEIEAKDHNFTSAKYADCEAINAKTASERLASAKTLKLKPGDYIFRVTNKNVPYPLGFYLRPASFLDRLKLPKVSGGGLTTGTTKDYKITLVKGEYVFSCPLNPTPDYKLVVAN
jgi:hypothetical protein